MIRTLYVQTEKDTNKVTDIIEFPYSDYKEIELELPLPPKIMSGVYKLTGLGVIYVPEWDIELKTLEEGISTLEVGLANAEYSLMMGGLM